MVNVNIKAKQDFCLLLLLSFYKRYVGFKLGKNELLLKFKFDIL